MSIKADKLYELISQIRPAYKLLSDAVECELSGTGISLPMKAVMETVASYGNRSVPELAQGMMISRQSVQPLVDRLFEDELLEKLENPRSKKSPLWALTRQGAHELSKIRIVEQNNLENIDSSFKLGDLEAAINVIQKLNEKFLNFKNWRNQR